MQNSGSSTNYSRINGNAPYLSLSSIHYSLTDGTSIPPPAPEDSKSSKTADGLLAPSKDSLGGPLSSHPVTPIEEPGRETTPFPSWSNGDSSLRSGAAPTNGSSTAHVPQASDDSNNFDPTLPPHKPVRDTSRRPSFVDRFLPRLRSSSFLRNRSRSSLGRFGDSSSSLARHQTYPDGSGAPSIDERGRGVKRPASPSTAGASDRPESRGSTFPRMMRKKSTELLSTARRRSGMWARGTGAESAMDEEKRREQAIEAAELENKRRIDAIRAQLDRKPPPKLPELPVIGGGGGLGGNLGAEELFSNIGR